MQPRLIAYSLSEELTVEEIDAVAGGPYTERRVSATHDYGPSSDSEEDGPAWDF